MSDKPSIGSFKIISLTKGSDPASVDLSKVGTQSVRLNESVQLWKIRAHEKVGDNTYRVRLAVGGYDAIWVGKDVVTASIHPDQDIEWIVTYREYNKAYTIAPVYDPSKGWTVPPDFEAKPVITIEPIISTKSIPPQYKPTQLWHFKLQLAPAEE